MGWQHHIAYAEGRSQRLREGVYVDDLFFLVDALQRRDGLAKKAELAVVIILYNIAVGLFAGPAKQLVASAYGHSNTGGKLMRGCNMENICATAF